MRLSVAQVDELAAMLCRSRLSRQRFDHYPTGSKPQDEAEAYAIQQALHRQLSRQGWGPIVGHKIGCTTRVMQNYLNIRSPCAGGVFESTVQREIGHVRIPAGLRVGVECEIAVVLGRDLSTDTLNIATAVDGCMAAVEIVEDRYVAYGSLDAPTLIADDFFGGGCVLGQVRSGFNAEQLQAVTARMYVNGIEVGSGAGTDVLEDPLNALSWLANSMAGRGQGLRRKEFVLLGSLVQVHWVSPGDEVLVRMDPLGDVRVTFS